MGELRFVVSVTADSKDGPWTVVIHGPGAAGDRPPRVMRNLPDGEGGYFPLPPSEEMPALEEQHPACKAYCLGLDAAGLKAGRQRIVNRSLDPKQGTSPFGGYLFRTLIGSEAWEWIKATAREEQARCIELALTWDRGQANLNRLNWEMMHDGQAFLVAGLPGLAVAITRRVAATKGERWTPRTFGFPPKVLFVVGTTLSDKTIRPAAEFLGLVRELRDSGQRIRTRILERAQPREIERVVRDFCPDLVHFICHGDWKPGTNEGFLELTPEPGSTECRYYAGQLYAAMTAEAGPPPIVVLSACKSGSTDVIPSTLQGAHDLAPLATELVWQGVPVVLGMAGRVSDTACRLFTRRFADALVRGESLVMATAEARRATVAQGKSAEQSVDWAFPALFMAEEVDPGYSLVQPDEVQLRTTEETWITNFDLDLVPVFCGRNEFFREYYGFFGSTAKRVLAIVGTGDAGVGKTRLLQELAKQMLRDGHVPIMLTSDNSDWEAPTTVPKLGRKLLSVIGNVRGHLELDTVTDGQLALLVYPARARPGRMLKPHIEQLLGEDGEVTAPALRLALQDELFELIKEARRKWVPIRQAQGRAVVLLDSVEQYEGLIDKLLRGQLLDGWGLGSSDEPIPVVLAFAMTQPTNTKVMSSLEQAGHKGWLNRLPLSPFDPDKDEDLLAYSWIVLNPFTNGYPELYSNVRHVLSDEAHPDVVRMARGVMKRTFAGLPRNLANPLTLYGFTEDARDGGFVVPLESDADDTKALAAARIDAEMLQ
jgi:CHAT domain